MERTETSRKDDHVSICNECDVEPSREVFDGYELLHTALPERSLESVSLETEFLGGHFAFPLLISGMTGGAGHARRINTLLADAALSERVPFGLGSLKILLSRPEFLPDFDVARGRPGLFVLGNFGAADLGRSIAFEDVRRFVETLGLGAVALHLNALQECAQPEGTRDFSNVLKNIETCVRTAGVPVVVKEVGASIGGADYARLRDTGVSAVDVAGRGGTSWALVEGMRSSGLSARLGSLFSRWGLPTPEAVSECHQMRQNFGDGPAIVASGGIRNGLEMALCLALGADMCGVALPLLRAAQTTQGEPAEAVRAELEFLRESLRVAMFCCGCGSPSDLRGRVRKRS